MNFIKKLCKFFGFSDNESVKGNVEDISIKKIMYLTKEVKLAQDPYSYISTNEEQESVIKKLKHADVSDDVIETVKYLMHYMILRRKHIIELMTALTSNIQKN